MKPNPVVRRVSLYVAGVASGGGCADLPIVLDKKGLRNRRYGRGCPGGKARAVRRSPDFRAIGDFLDPLGCRRRHTGTHIDRVLELAREIDEHDKAFLQTIPAEDPREI